MSLQFVAGSSGAGKSHIILQEILERSLVEPDKQFLILVPEQATMQVQKELVERHPRGGMLNVDVLSFHRLARRVFEEVGGNTRPVLEDTGKNLVLRRVVEKQKDKLTILGKTLTRQGSLSLMKSLLSEFMQYGVQPEDLRTWQEEQGDTLLARKLQDIALIYEAFRSYLSDSYVTTEEIPEVLCRVIGESTLLRDSVLVFDGFTGFTPVQLQVLSEMFSLVESVTIVLTADPEVDLLTPGSKQDLFFLSRDTVRRCLELARERHIEVRPTRWILPTEDSRFSKSPSLSFLEKNLFRQQPAIYAPVPQEMELFEATDPTEELRHVAACILRDVREKGRSFRDFAVVTGDLEEYGREAFDLFTEAGIPCFLDQRRSAMANPLVTCIRSALQMTAKNYTYETVFRFLRCGLTHFTKEEIDELENYVLATGIRGRKQYMETWTLVPKQTDAERLPALNALRAQFVQETEDLHVGLRERTTTVRDKIEVLYRFLIQYEPQKKLEQKKEELLLVGEAAQAKEYEQIYAAVMDLFDKVVEVLGEEKAGMASLADLLDAGFAELRIGLIPPGEDVVLIGDIERTRLPQIKTLFFVGVQDGVIPRAASTKDLLSEADREWLEQSQVSLAPTPREEMIRQRFYLYLTMTKPSSSLILSFCRTGKDGKSRQPSYLIRVLERLFPQIRHSHVTWTEHVTEEDLQAVYREAMETEEGQMRLLLSALQQLPEREPSAAVMELFLQKQKVPESQPRLERLLEAAGSKQDKTGIGRAVARALYGSELTGYATRLEQFAGCAYRHFCEQGLRLQQREVYAFTAADIGTVMHRALQRFALLLRKNQKDWAALAVEEQKVYADRALEESVLDYEKNILTSSAQNRFRVERFRSLLYRTVWTQQMQLQQSAFRPADFEFRFGNESSAMRFSLSETSSMRLSGQIDRVDLCERDGIHYVKIVDYKTGNTKFDLTRMQEGLQLQLFLYLNAVLENEQARHLGEPVEPAGVLYAPVTDPYVQLNGTQEEVQAALLKEVRPTGRVRAEESVLQLLDRSLQSQASSLIVPARKKKDGSVYEGESAIDKETFHLLSQFTNSKVQELGKRILRGETAANPYRVGQAEACTYCAYQGVCGFDERIPGYRYRRFRKKSEEEILDQMQQVVTKQALGQRGMGDS